MGYCYMYQYDVVSEVEDKMHLLVLPHFASNIVAMLQLIDEALAGVVEQKTSNTTESLGGQELDLGVGLLGVHQPSGVDLDLLEVDGAGTNSHGEFLSIASAVITVGGGQLVVLRAMLLEERVGSEIGSIATGGKDDGAVGCLSLSGTDVLDTNDGAGLVLEELGDAGLLQDLDAVRITDGEILEPLHLSIGDNLKTYKR